MKLLKRKLKPRYIFCITALIILLISYFIFLCCYARTYNMSFMLSGTTDIDSVRVEFSDDNVVKVKSIGTGNLMDLFNTIEVGLESVNVGSTEVTVYYNDNYDYQILDENSMEISKAMSESKEYKSVIYVTPLGIIYNITSDNFNGMWSIKILAYAMAIVIIITLSLSFKEKLRRGDYTYSMVTMGGVIFFLTIAASLELYDAVDEWKYNNIMDIRNVIYSISNISNRFTFITIVPMLLFCLLLCISNISLVRHEGFHYRNLLGFMLGFAAIGMVAMMFSFVQLYNQYSQTTQLILIMIYTGVSFTFSYMESLLVSTVFCAVSATKYEIKQPMDYIIILGCAIMKDGTPTPILRGRIDRALAFDKEQYEKWGKHAKFVPSGGQGSNEVVSEAESMKRYLMEQGIPEECILKEDKSVNTYQNMAFSKKVIEGDSENINDKSVAFSTTNYHVFRGYTLAEKLGFKVKGLSARTKLYFFPNAFLREFIGLLWEKKKYHILIIFSGVAVLMTLYLIAQY